MSSQDRSFDELQEALDEQDETAEPSERPQNKRSPKEKGSHSPTDDHAAESSGKASDSKSSLLSDLKPGPSSRPNKTGATFSLSEDLLERLRNACYWERLVMSKVVERAIADAVAAIEEEGNDGEPYDQRKNDLPTSRPSR